ncbi:MAG: DnaJ domain-containing protein [Nocardioides sp.]
MNVNWYDVLDVEPTASADEVRAAWRSAVADLDPTDRRFRVFNQAAEVLLDPVQRAAYDAEFARARSDEAERRDDRSEPEAGLLARTDGGSRSVEPIPSVTPVVPRRGAWQVPGWVLVAVALLTAIALGYVGVTLTRSSPASVQSDTSAAQAAAERAIVPLLSYDAHHLDRSAAQATPYLTDSERQQYDKLFAVIRQNAPRTGTVVKAKYLASGIVRSGTDRVDVLVFVNQATWNKQHPKTPVDYKNQVTVTMAKVGDSWLVDDLTTNTARS